MKISQREARRNLKRLRELENALETQRSAYVQSYFGGVQIANVTLLTNEASAIRTARRLKHAVVVVSDDSDTIRFVALPHPKARD